MFNPIFNADGSLSYFRVTCLIVALGCLIGGCVMDSSSDSKNKDEVSEDVTAQVENQDSCFQAEDGIRDRMW